MLETSADIVGESGIFEAAFVHGAMGMLFVAPDLRVVRANQALATMLGQGHQDLVGLDILQLAESEDRATFREGFRFATPGSPASVDVRLMRLNNVSLWVRVDIASVPAPTGFVLHLRDMTVRRRLDMEHALTVEVFDILDRTDIPETTARHILSATRRALGVEAAAIRLAREGDFTYAAHEGFPADFIAAKNCLRALDEKGAPAFDEQGRPLLECTCGLVLMGRTDPSNPIFTVTGCVCVNDSAALKSHDAPDTRIAARDRCLHLGYRSVALIPIRSRNSILGLLQLNDHRPHQFPPELMSFLEGIASSVGFALERKRTQDRLARSYELLCESEARFRELFERSPVAMWEEDLTLVAQRFAELRREGVTDLRAHMDAHPEVGSDLAVRARVQVVNEASLKLMGARDVQELAGHLGTFFDDSAWTVFRDQVARLYAGEEQLEAETTLRDAKGNVLDLNLRVSVLQRSAGEPSRVLVSFTDLSARRAAEKHRRELEREVDHLQRLESMGRLAGGVAHDMNNVLGVIMAIGSLLEENANPVIAKDAQKLVRAATRGRDLVKGLRDFSRKEMRSAAEVDLNEIARHEAELIERTCLKRIAVSLDLEAGLPTVFGEGTSMQNALMNLCVNAMDAMPNKGTLTLRTRRIGDGFVELVVEDSGEGMPPEVLARALEPFFTTKPLGKGTGLGLSQVYGTMKAHGGSVTIDSTVGAGTRVHLVFPVMGTVLATTVGAESPAATPSLSVLVVDDEDALRGPLLRMLRSLGHEGQEAGSGLEALSKVEGGAPVDLVVLDLNMPGLDGVETLSRLRILRPDLPVLLATGHADERLPALLARFSGVRVLMKPFGRRELAEALSALRWDFEPL